MEIFDQFERIWLVDFEFSVPTGERPSVACMVGRELRTGELLRLTADQLQTKSSPIPTDEKTLFVAYFASAELGCYLSLGWDLPTRILDLYVEFKNHHGGIKPTTGYGLLGALAYYGLDSIAGDEKQEMRELAMRGGPYTGEEMLALLDYCQTDVDALAKLLPCMAPDLDLPRALLRGRYMASVARMEADGIPIDLPLLEQFRESWDDIKVDLIREVDSAYGVYDGTTFKQDLFAKYLTRKGIAWPLTDDGRLSLRDDTFRSQCKSHPELNALRELRFSLSRLKPASLAVGRDGRNRFMLSPFSSVTSRNQPSNAKAVFGPAAWMRGFIKPDVGRAVIYLDWSQQELGIAAALSGDRNMMAAYASGDPYLAFARQAGAVPADATKQSHPVERESFKVCALAVQYGMTEKGLAASLGKPEAFARNLLLMHRETYPRFWGWSQSRVDLAMLTGRISTRFGWQVRSSGDSNPRSLANFTMQANGAEMLRLACCEATESGVMVCAPVHDALLVECNVGEVESTIERVQGHMANASRIVLDGFALATDADVTKYPDRYMDKRGKEMWDRVMGLVSERSEPSVCVA